MLDALFTKLYRRQDLEMLASATIICDQATIILAFSPAGSHNLLSNETI
ncbi:MAG TPA: hypothetical protein VMT67_01505 [Terriglobales bacterium]|nr:hypothetical protein [Terriglobales bacterium]